RRILGVRAGLQADVGDDEAFGGARQERRAESERRQSVDESFHEVVPPCRVWQPHDSTVYLNKRRTFRDVWRVVSNLFTSSVGIAAAALVRHFGESLNPAALLFVAVAGRSAPSKPGHKLDSSFCWNDEQVQGTGFRLSPE